MPDNTEDIPEETGHGRTPVDVNAMRDLIIRMHGLTKADTPYTLYYDETNNIRRLLLTPEGMNNPNPQCFALGGIAYTGEDRDFRYEEFRKALRIQKTAKEVKLEHVAKGDFLALVASPKTETFLRWLIAERYFIHCVVLDPLYWSIVNIIDSVLTAEENAYLLPIDNNLKSDLYAVLIHDRPQLIGMLHKYSYPNVGRENKNAFIRDLLDALEAGEDLLPHFNYQMLKGALQIALKQSALAYLEDEADNVLVDELSSFFINRICIFKHSRHIFDQEPWIERLIQKLAFKDGDRDFSNFQFADSIKTPGTQLSDVTIGLLGKYFSFVNQTEWTDLQLAKNALSQRQRSNTSLLKTLIESAIAENPIFFHSILSIDDHRKSNYFLDL